MIAGDQQQASTAPPVNELNGVRFQSGMKPARNSNNYASGRQYSGKHAANYGSNINKSFQQFQSLHHSQQKQQQQMMSDTPLYVPPYLLETMRSQNRSGGNRDHNTPYDYLPWSIANIFICVFFAMPALFFSIQTREMNKLGNAKKAKVHSKRSLIFNIVASVVGIATILLAVILRFALYQLFVHNDINSYSVPIIAGG